jgi:hypothetical protein
VKVIRNPDVILGIPVKSVKPGDVFQHGPDLFMRIKTHGQGCRILNVAPPDEGSRFRLEEPMRCCYGVHLETGVIRVIHEDRLVIPVNAAIATGV